MDISHFPAILCLMSNLELSTFLLNWYDANGRNLPWRVKGGAHPDPYAVLVSEFMLQQTTVKTVLGYFEKFMHRFPTVESLAAADEEEVYRYWQGLGYYTRARSLHATAQIIVSEFNSRFPDNRTDVLRLKGIGPYTVASFLALAFNQPETVVDGNVIRIICRLYHLTQPFEEIKPLIAEKAAALTSHTRPADYASAIMDLGATVCTPKNPQCLICPWQKACLSRGRPDIEQIPARLKNTKQIKNGSVCLITDSTGRILIRRRTEKGLLSGLYELPWTAEGSLPFSDMHNTGLSVTHIFTHIRQTLTLFTLQTDTSPIADGFFISPSEIKNYPFSTLMKKILKRTGLI